jgi:hypothetical protein
MGEESFPQINDLVDGINAKLTHSSTSNNMKDVLLDHLCSIIHVVGRRMRIHQAIILQLIVANLRNHLLQCLDIIEAVVQVFSVTDVNSFLLQLSPHYMNVFESEPVEEELVADRTGRVELKKTTKILQSVVNIKDYLGALRRYCAFDLRAMNWCHSNCGFPSTNNIALTARFSTNSIHVY